MKRQKLTNMIFFAVLCFWPLVLGQDPPQPAPPPKPPPQNELWVRGAVVNPEVVGDELAQIKLEVLILQGRKVDWEALKSSKNFEPFVVEGFSATQKGIPLDPRFKDYNAFEVLVFLSLADKPCGKYETQALPLEVSFTDFQYKGQAVEGKEKKKTIYLKGFVVSKVPLRAELEADKKSLEIGDQFEIALNIVHDPTVRILNLKQSENAGDSESDVLFLDKVKIPGSEVLNVQVEEREESVYRKKTKIAYLLTSFELPPKELKIGPLAVLYREKDTESAQSYKTGELAIKLNSVLIKSSQWEGTRTPIFSDSFERFWLVLMPRYGSMAFAMLLAMMLCFWLVNLVLAGRKKVEEEILPVQRMLENKLPVPFFLKHWLYLKSSYKSLHPSDRGRFENFVYHYRLCVGSAEGLSENQALALTAGQLKKCTARSAFLLGELENSLFENVGLRTTTEEVSVVLNDMARTKAKEGLRRSLVKLRSFFKDKIRKS